MCLSVRFVRRLGPRVRDMPRRLFRGVRCFPVGGVRNRVLGFAGTRDGLQ